MIGLQGVWRTYPMGEGVVHALRDVSLSIAAGEYVALIGPSGSGKSTLLHILGCLDRPTQGRYSFEGREVGSLPDGERSLLRRNRIGFVFQFFHLLPRLTAQGNVELPMLFGGIARDERRERATRALASVGLLPRAGHRPDQLSGGERQRAAIARAVVMNPAVLLADEPTGNLDRASAQEVMGVLEAMNRQGLTLVVVTHDPVLAGHAQRVVHLTDGALSGPPEVLTSTVEA
ncbi:ABC transporter ATP-binding protein [Geothrix fuzhouensis]|uniref:ABC transporter ATP-binding protein n=1 Tax=Geothrix fuzhouensis TaxID=2966451 RepID=UPI0021498E53|nr:ABC transporter ATP-binding protein [Geothrix fuzhouensis]